MAATKKNKQKRPMPGSLDGNLARKLDSRELERRLEASGQMDFDRQYRQRQETEMERRSRQRAAAKAAAAMRAAQKISPVVLLCFAATAGMMVAVLLCYIQLNAISRSIVDMKTQIDELQVQQVSLLTRYEQAFDLTSVKAAAEASGMTQPSDSQIYYIDLPGSDQAVSYGDDDIGPVSRFFTKVRDKLTEVMEYFQ